MKIRLKEREEAVLSELKIETTFKIRESSFVFMKIDVDGLTVRPKRSHTTGPLAEQEIPKPIKVLIPEGKTPVLCVSTGKAQFLNLDEKVQIVELECIEIAKEKQAKVMTKPQQLGGIRRSDATPSL